MRSRGFLFLLSLCFLCLCVEPSRSLIFERNLPSGAQSLQRTRDAVRFFFLSGGSFSVDCAPSDDADVDSADIQQAVRDGGGLSGSFWFLCTEAEYRANGGFTTEAELGPARAFCPLESADDGGWCDIAFPLLTCVTTGNMTKHAIAGNVTSRGMFYQVVVNCNPSSLPATVTTEFLNPYGEHLGYDTMALPSLYSLMSIMWSILFVTGAWNWFTHRRQSTRLHTVLSAYPLAKLAWLVVAVLYWQDLSGELLFCDWGLGVFLGDFFPSPPSIFSRRRVDC
jgi:hypothetical protein